MSDIADRLNALADDVNDLDANTEFEVNTIADTIGALRAAAARVEQQDAALAKVRFALDVHDRWLDASGPLYPEPNALARHRVTVAEVRAALATSDTKEP